MMLTILMINDDGVAKSRMPSADSAGPASPCGARSGCGPYTISDPRGRGETGLACQICICICCICEGFADMGAAYHGETRLVEMDTCICAANWVHSNTTW